MMYSNEEPFTLSCCVQGYPKPRITWLKNNKPLPTNRDQYTLQNDNQELTIERLLSRDSGEYTCIAINIHGVSNYTIFMDIRGELKHILVSIGFLWLKPSVKFAVSAIPLFLFTSGDVIIDWIARNKHQTKYLITKRDSYAVCRMVSEPRKQSSSQQITRTIRIFDGR